MNILKGMGGVLRQTRQLESAAAFRRRTSAKQGRGICRDQSTQERSRAFRVWVCVSSRGSSQPAPQLCLIGLVKHVRKEKGSGKADNRCARRKERGTGRKRTLKLNRKYNPKFYYFHVNCYTCPHLGWIPCHPFVSSVFTFSSKASQFLER